MKHVKKSVLLWYSPDEMYRLVTRIADYPRFLPWCERAEVLESTETSTTARLSMRFAGLRQSFTTRNLQVPGESVHVGLVDGPFSVLDGDWRFQPVGNDGNACRIDFELRYAFATRTLEAVVSPVFDRVANSLVDSFVKRAAQVYGEQ